MDMESIKVIDFFVEYSLTLVVIFFPSLIGSFGKEYLAIMQGKARKISIPKMIIASLTSTILLFGFSDVLLSKISFKILMVLAFVTGLVGFQLFEQLSTLEGIKKLANDFKEFRDYKKKDDKK